MPEINGMRYEEFVWKGQTRYRCRGKWESGSPCSFDTPDLNMLVKHMASPHLRMVPTGPGTPPPEFAPAFVPATVADNAKPSEEFGGAKFADDADAGPSGDAASE